MTGPTHPLERKLGYAFRNPAWLRQALTHRSAGPLHNERLEFLGDAVLELLVSELLFDRYPDADEGTLSRLRARLVRQESLARMARSLELGACLSLGAGEKGSGGSSRESTLANAVEALLGAIYLDGGLGPARAQALAWLQPLLDGLGQADDMRDAKTRLQEYLQARTQPLPEYTVEAMTGKEHARHFRVSCRVTLLPKAVLGEGSSRRIAEQQAAARVLAQLQGES